MNSNVNDDVPSPAEERRQRQALQAREGAEAMAEYKEEARILRERTAQLRALRLAREAANAAAAPAKKASASLGKRTVAKKSSAAKPAAKKKKSRAS